LKFQRYPTLGIMDDGVAILPAAFREPTIGPNNPDVNVAAA